MVGRVKSVAERERRDDLNNLWILGCRDFKGNGQEAQ